MDYVDTRFIGLVSSRLQKFKRIKPNLFTFRCPICGDSEKNKNKTRGYLYAVKTHTNFKCHNCGASSSFYNFLKQIDVQLHKQYILEKFKSGHNTQQVAEPDYNFEKPNFARKLQNGPLKFERPTSSIHNIDRAIAKAAKERDQIDLPKASTNVAAVTYLEGRKLDPNKFYYADKFKRWTNTKVFTFGQSDLKYDEPRIIIPLYYQNDLVGFQGRALGSSKIKYITIMINDDAPKIYGLDNIRGDAPVFVTEGPFDSSFVRNSIALCGADGDVGKWGVSDPIWVYDNEPRNREIVKRISDTIDRGEKVVIWPENMWEKDINDMVVNGHMIMDLLESNTYKGLEAQIKFNNWKKV